MNPQERKQNRQQKITYFFMSMFLFLIIYGIGYFCMNFVSFAMSIHPYFQLAFYIFWYFLDLLVTKKLMSSNIVCVWIKQLFS